MALQTTEAVVLRNIRLGETSKILTLYTRHLGIEKVVAKGSRSIKSRYWGALEPLNHIQIVFYHHSQRELQLLSQADIVQTFSDVRQDLRKTAYALAVGEILMRTQFQGESNFQLFHLLVDTLSAMNASAWLPVSTFLGFQVKFLDLTGVSPNLNQCLICQRTIERAPVGFDFEGGGIVCQSCRPFQGKTLLSDKGLRFLRWLRSTTLVEICRHPIPPAILNEAEKILALYSNYHLEGLHHLRSLEFLTRIELGMGK
ncbi:DNA repair protein RecO [candidate division KSB1 bacterium]|nr:DNA repair protein RecO [candidate division KSB1 bacterium]